LIPRFSVMIAFSFLHWATSPFFFSFRLASCSLIFSSLSFDAGSFSFLSASCSIMSWRTFRSISSISIGMESISILIRDAASSTRSIALSGRKRSVM